MSYKVKYKLIMYSFPVSSIAEQYSTLLETS